MTPQSLQTAGLLVGTGVRGGRLSLLTRGLLTASVLVQVPDQVVQDALVTEGLAAARVNVPDAVMVDALVPDQVLMGVDVEEDPGADGQFLVPLIFDLEEDEGE